MTMRSIEWNTFVVWICYGLCIACIALINGIWTSPTGPFLIFAFTSPDIGISMVHQLEISTCWQAECRFYRWSWKIFWNLKRENFASINVLFHVDFVVKYMCSFSCGSGIFLFCPIFIRQNECRFHPHRLDCHHEEIQLFKTIPISVNHQIFCHTNVSYYFWWFSQLHSIEMRLTNSSFYYFCYSQ